MARIVALEWDGREARIAAGGSRGNDVLVEQAFAVELASASGLPTWQEVSRQLATVLAEHGLTGCDALVALPRSQIELRTLTLPQAPPEEIPDMVRFQAMQAFTSIGEDWPLDYVQLEGHEASINVLATVVSPKLIEQTEAICAESALKVRCLVLRPFAAISLLHRYESIDVFRCGLIVDLLPEAADLTAINNGQVVFMRSVRLPAHTEPAAQARALVGELRRTIGAAQNQMGAGRIEQIVICGSAEENAELCKSVADALSLEVLTFQPFEAVRLTRELSAQLPADSGRFAPLLGMLACHVTGTGHTIDFLNPRKRPVPPSRRLRHALVAAVLLLVTGVGAALFYAKKASLDSEIALLQQQSADLDQGVAKARELMALVDRIKQFESGDVTWLDEIREAAQRLPDADDVILNEIFVGVDPEQGGRMTLKGNVATSDVIAKLEQSLRYGGNRVRGYYGSLDPTRRDYPYQIETTVTVPPDVLENGHSLGRPKLEAATKERSADATQVEAPPDPEGDAAVTKQTDAPSRRARPRSPATPNAAESQPDTDTETTQPAASDPAENATL